MKNFSMNTSEGLEESKTGDFSTKLRKYMQDELPYTKDSLTKILKKRNKIIEFAKSMDECYQEFNSQQTPFTYVCAKIYS